MTIRFRLSDQAFLQQQTLKVPMSLIEQLVQPTWRGAGVLLSARRLQQLPAQLQAIARPFIGLSIVANGAGLITQITVMQHRLSVAEQDTQFGLGQGKKRVAYVTETAPAYSLTVAS